MFYSIHLIFVTCNTVQFNVILYLNCDTMLYLRFLRFSRTSGIWGAWCKVDYYERLMTRSIRTTPRGTQDKQPLAPTWHESPWTSADYKTWYTGIKQLVIYENSVKQHLRSVTRKLLYGYNKRITRLAYRPLRLPTSSFHLIARYRYALDNGHRHAQRPLTVRHRRALDLFGTLLR